MHSSITASRLVRACLCAGVLFCTLAGAPARAVTLDELARKLDALESQNADLKAKVERLEAAQQRQAAQVSTPVPAAAAAVAANPTPAAATVPAGEASSGPASALADWAQATTVSSYGEIGYSRPSKEPSQANVNVGRAVIGMQHQFDDATKMVAEFEWENAVTSADDTGEAEVEQLLIEHEFNIGVKGTAGLYLMPAGLINQNHEPTAYYGVFRPDVDTKIIPSTWREVGIAVAGSSDIGLSWDSGVTTAPNLSHWAPDETEALQRGPLQSIHGEGQFATARDLGVHASLNWRVPGALLGAFVFAGKIGQQQPGFLGNDSRLVLWDVHGRYERAGWEFAGEFARGTISRTDALNASFVEQEFDNPTFVPAVFQGGYVQAAYHLWQGHHWSITPFSRYEVYNTAKEYSTATRALGAVERPDEKLWTIGASVFLGEGVVFKIDYRRYSEDQYPSEIPPAFNRGNSLNLGMGYSF